MGLTFVSFECRVFVVGVYYRFGILNLRTCWFGWYVSAVGCLVDCLRWKFCLDGFGAWSFLFGFLVGVFCWFLCFLEFAISWFSLPVFVLDVWILMFTVVQYVFCCFGCF